MDTAQLHRLFLDSRGAFTDTRRPVRDGIYFALKGPTFNGNRFAATALAAGASLAVVDETDGGVQPGMVVVDDALTALHDLARFHRRFLGIPVIGITGSNGKTTNKELIAAVLARKYRTLFTEGNLNNHIGVPLTLLRLTAEQEVAVVEMGANHKREIAHLCEIAEPDYALITSIGLAHLEGFGSPEGIRQGKRELFEFVTAHGGTCFVNLGVPVVPGLFDGPAERAWFFGDSGQLPCATTLPGGGFIRLQVRSVNGEFTVNSNLMGAFQANNLLHAWAIGEHFGVAPESIAAALEAYVPSNNRAQLLERDGMRILLDAYNANPSSVKAALRDFLNDDAEHKLPVLGDMLELGDSSGELHQEIVDLLERKGVREAVLIGPEYGAVRAPAGFRRFDSTAEAKAWWKAQDFSGYYILIKGSRGMALEKLLDADDRA